MDKELLWLLARLYVVLRHGYITSHLEAVYAELGSVLSNAKGLDMSVAEDENILGAFDPAKAVPPQPSRSGKEAKG